MYVHLASIQWGKTFWIRLRSESLDATFYFTLPIQYCLGQFVKKKSTHPVLFEKNYIGLEKSNFYTKTTTFASPLRTNMK